MTVINRKIDGKIKYFEVTPGGVQIEIDKDEYDKKLEVQIKDFKANPDKKAKGGLMVKKSKKSGSAATRGYGCVMKGKK